MDGQNDNRGAGWPAKAVAGNCMVNGRRFFMQLVGTGARAENAPTSMMYLRSPDDRNELHVVAMFRKDESKAIAGGTLDMPEGAYWVNLFKNASEKDNSPLVDVTFQLKEQQAPAAAPGFPPPDDDIPF